MTRHTLDPRPAGMPAFTAAPHGTELPPMVAAFLDRLRRVPLGAWMEAGRRLADLDERDRQAMAAGTSASGQLVRSELRQVVNAMPRVAAQTRQRVDHLATAAQGFVHPAEVARMKKAALAAALALVARPALGEERFAQIYEPFAALIPLASLKAAQADGTLPWWPAPDVAAPPRPGV